MAMIFRRCCTKVRPIDVLWMHNANFVISLIVDDAEPTVHLVGLLHLSSWVHVHPSGKKAEVTLLHSVSLDWCFLRLSLLVPPPHFRQRNDTALVR